MANKPISIEFIADVASYLREVKKVEVSTDDVAEALVGVSSDAEDLERKLSRAMRDSAKDTAVLESAIKGVGDATDRAADDAERDFDRIGDEAKSAGRETGGNFRQSLGEGLSSGGSLSDVVSETLGEAVGGLEGPVGAAVGIIAGGALLIFNKVKAQIEEFNAAVTAQAESMWGTALESIAGKIGEVGIEITNAKLAQQELDRLWQDSPDEMTKLVEAAEALGINAWDIVAARAGDEEAIKRVKGELEKVYAQQNAGLGVTAETVAAVDDIEQGLGEAETAQRKWNAQTAAYNASIQPGAAALAQMKTDMEWINQHKNIDVKVRAGWDASEFRQMFPYGIGGGTSTYKPKFGG